METYRRTSVRGLGGLAILSIFLGILGLPFIWKYQAIAFAASIVGLLIGLFGLAAPGVRGRGMSAPLFIGVLISLATLIWNLVVAFGWVSVAPVSWLA